MRAGAWIRPLVFAVAVGCSADGDKTPNTSSGTGTDTGTATGSETRADTEVGAGTRTDTGTATGTRTGNGTGTASRTDTGTGTASGDGADYVDAHNAVRAAVVKPTNYPAGQTWEPIPPVTWSASVAATAQAWADHLVASGCVLEHDTKSGYGENLAMGTNLAAQGAVNLWAGEKTAYTYNARYQFESSTGHYTQLVWRKSTQIGCGSATCDRAVIVCCRYSPPGNTIGQQPY